MVSSSSANKVPGDNGSAPFKALIVTADDFGLSREINAGVLKAHRDGILTAASLIVAGEACEEAASLARETATLDVGLHLVVCRGRALTRSPLVDSAGAFAHNPTLTGIRYFFNRRLRSHLRDEIRAQIDRHLSLVGYLKHIDGHLNFHVHPVIADLTVELASEYHVSSIRVPREPVFTTLRLARDHAPRKAVEALIFRALSRRTRRLLDAHNLRTSDYLFGLHQSGHLSAGYVRGLIPRLPPGLTELYFHPALDIGAVPPPAAAQAEVAILTDPMIRRALASSGVRLTSFARLAS
ncbi:MAG TPA: hopanoid biosynthesis-associated protein HpnK [Candidatus Binataceae bacterium]|jgi:hopanoid biosynthesis associated protein HpnK|nr:hopanoid biosynthesis-associated protein HpnK [Candidatus Binataceae bacterium]